MRRFLSLVAPAGFGRGGDGGFWRAIEAHCRPVARGQYRHCAPPGIDRDPEFLGRDPMDALSDILKSVRLEGAVYLNAEFSAPWCVQGECGIPKVKERHGGGGARDVLPLPHRRRVQGAPRRQQRDRVARRRRPAAVPAGRSSLPRQRSADRADGRGRHGLRRGHGERRIRADPPRRRRPGHALRMRLSRLQPQPQPAAVRGAAAHAAHSGRRRTRVVAAARAVANRRARDRSPSGRAPNRCSSKLSELLFVEAMRRYVDSACRRKAAAGCRECAIRMWAARSG